MTLEISTKVPLLAPAGSRFSRCLTNLSGRDVVARVGNDDIAVVDGDKTLTTPAVGDGEWVYDGCQLFRRTMYYQALTIPPGRKIKPYGSTGRPPRRRLSRAVAAKIKKGMKR